MYFKLKLQNLFSNKIVLPLSLVIVIAIVVLSYLLGVSTGKKHIQSTNILNGNQDILNETVELEKELNLCLSDEASMTASQEDGLYNFSTFGIFSPLLQNKPVNKIDYMYKQALITSRTIDVNENIRIKTWILEKPSEYLQTLPERLSKKEDILDLSYPLYDFPVFDGYEWTNKVADNKYVSSRIHETTISTDVFLSNKNIKMYKVTRVCPKSPCIAELYFYKNTNQGKTQTFVQVLSDISSFPMETNNEILNNSVLKAYSDAETFADTLSFEEY